MVINVCWFGGFIPAGKTSFGIDIRQHSGAHKHGVRVEHETRHYGRRLQRWRMSDISATESKTNIKRKK